jgi:hypothetical protein
VKILVDTSIWSMALRRRDTSKNVALTSALASLIEDGRAVIIGPIRQELLSGIKERAQFERLREHLQAFPDVAVTTEDYEEAAAFFNLCRDRGIQGSNTDFLICAVAVRKNFSIFTNDDDFAHFASVLPISLHSAVA